MPSHSLCDVVRPHMICQSLNEVRSWKVGMSILHADGLYFAARVVPRVVPRHRCAVRFRNSMRIDVTSMLGPGFPAASFCTHSVCGCRSVGGSQGICAVVILSAPSFSYRSMAACGVLCRIYAALSIFWWSELYNLLFAVRHVGACELASISGIVAASHCAV
jgi:hypothetical protein